MAFHLVLVATTAQLVLVGFSGGGDLLWRVLQPAFAERRGAANVMVRDMDLVRPDVHDTRRLEVVVDGLSLFGGVQLAVDTTVVSALHANGEARRNAARRDGVALEAARRRKERTYPELTARGGWAKLVVLGVAVGGRWSSETRSFLSKLARDRARSEGSLRVRRSLMRNAWNKHGAFVGAPCPAPPHVQSPCLRWTSQVPEGLMGRALCHTMWNGISGTPVWMLGE